MEVERQDSTPMLRRLLRFVFSALCLLSLLSCVGTGWLGWRRRQHLFVDDVTIGSHSGALEVCSSPQGLYVCWLRGWPQPLGIRSRAYATENDYLREIVASRPPITYNEVNLPLVDFVRVSEEVVTTRDGFRALLQRETQGMDFPLLTTLKSAGISARHTTIFVLFVLPPLLWLGLHFRRPLVLRRRRRRGLCLACGYDLAGNTSGRCSECGTIATQGVF